MFNKTTNNHVDGDMITNSNVDKRSYTINGEVDLSDKKVEPKPASSWTIYNILMMVLAGGALLVAIIGLGG